MGFCDVARSKYFARAHLTQRAERSSRALDVTRRAEFAAGKKICAQRLCGRVSGLTTVQNARESPDRFAPACAPTARSVTARGTSQRRRAQNYRSRFGLHGKCAELLRARESK
jgi:hypothetical protein